MIRGELLPAWARATIARLLGVPMPLPEDDASLEEPGASFVTLTQNGRLRGCIGSLVADRPVRLDVMVNAAAAATRDHRFAPMTAAELPHTKVEVSLLAEPEPTGWRTFDDTLRGVRPGIDGLILSSPSQGVRGTFLPSVWGQLTDPRDFLTRLVAKAGLHSWPDDAEVQRYTVTTYTEKEPS